MRKLSLNLSAALLGVVAIIGAGLALRPDAQLQPSVEAAGGSPDGVATEMLPTHSEPVAPPRVAVADKAVDRPRCALRCEHGLLALRAATALSDADFDVQHADAPAVAQYVRHDSDVRSELVALAVRTDDGNKRRLIRAIFAELPGGQRIELGKALLLSPDALIRREGINFLSDPATLDDKLAIQFVDLLATEFVVNTKIALVRALNKPDQFRDSAVILDGLSDSLRTEIDAQLRGEALVVSVDLSDDPDAMFFDVLAAIQSQDTVYSVYGMRALDAILRRQTTDDGSLSWQRRAQAKVTLEELLDPAALTVQPDLVEVSSQVYARHFW